MSVTKRMQLSPKLRAWLDEFQRGVYLYDIERNAFRDLDYETFSEFQTVCEQFNTDTVADALGEPRDDAPGGEGGDDGERM